jgi:5-oxoprolinase (ATP-hydrolysing)/N-methylhydantoinase B
MVTMNIIDSAMVAICREMGVNVQKTAYSTIFSEAEDFTCALASPEGQMIAVAEFCPAQIGGVPLLVSSMVQEITDINPGDVIVHNDPYRGGLHTPEHTMFKPIFVADELMGFAVSIGHFVEVGGMVPGGFPGEATEIFHEGLRVPPVKLIKRGKDVPEVWKLLLANVRTPRGNYGDLRALISAVDMGEKRLVELIEKYGKDVFRQTVSDLMDYSESRMRAEIANFPDGRYTFEDCLEDDGIEAKEYWIRVAVNVQGDEVVIAGQGADQRHSRRRLVGLLQCHAAPDRPDHPEEFRLLPPDPRDLAGRHDNERQLSRLRSGRQHRDPSADRRLHLRRHVGMRAAPGDGLGRHDPWLLRLRRP